MSPMPALHEYPQTLFGGVTKCHPQNRDKSRRKCAPPIFHRLVVLFPRHYIDQDLTKQFFGHFGCAVHFSLGMANIWHDILSTGQR